MNSANKEDKTEPETSCSGHIKPVVSCELLNDNQKKGLPKNIDLLIHIADSVVYEARNTNSMTRRIKQLERMVVDVNRDYQKIYNSN